MTPIVLHLPLRTTNPMNGSTGNTRVAAAIRTRRRAQERKLTLMALYQRAHYLRHGSSWPVTVTLTRMSAGTMDTDGLAASFKGIRDGVAEALGVDDGDKSKVRFEYEQRKCPRGAFGVEIRVEARGG